jgi:hypothetical protein
VTLECPACGNPSRDGGLDDRCEVNLVALLREVPRLLAQLLIQTTRQTASGGTERRGAASRPLPLNLTTAELSSAYEALLTSWALAMGADQDAAFKPGGRESAFWLSRHFYEIRTHPAVGDMLDELTKQAGECLRAIDRGAGDRVFLGICRKPLPTDGQECMTALRVPKSARKVDCWRCSAEYDVAELLAARDDAIDGSLATVAEIAAAGFRTPDGRVITGRMVEGYATRGRILAHGHRHNETLGRDAALYLIGEVKQAALEARYPKARMSA